MNAFEDVTTQNVAANLAVTLARLQYPYQHLHVFVAPSLGHSRDWSCAPVEDCQQKRPGLWKGHQDEWCPGRSVFKGGL